MGWTRSVFVACIALIALGLAYVVMLGVLHR